MNHSDVANVFRPVRWPFRFLAALILAALGAAVLGYAWAILNGDARPGDQASTRLLAILPVLACMLNWAWSAAVHGRAPTHQHWPFASERVLTAYLIAVYVLQWH